MHFIITLVRKDFIIKNSIAYLAAVKINVYTNSVIVR